MKQNLIASILVVTAMAGAMARTTNGQQLDTDQTPGQPPSPLNGGGQKVGGGSGPRSMGACTDSAGQKEQLQREDQRHAQATSRLSSALEEALKSGGPGGQQAANLFQQEIDSENKLHECTAQWIHGGCPRNEPPCQPSIWDQLANYTQPVESNKNSGGCGQAIKGPWVQQGSIVACIRKFQPCQSITVQVAPDGDPQAYGYTPGSEVTFTQADTALGVPPLGSQIDTSPGATIKLDVGRTRMEPYYVGMWPWGQASCPATGSAQCPKAPAVDSQVCWAHLPPGKLCAEKGQFWNENGQVVELRGVNVAGTSKTPPFLPLPKSAHVTYPPTPGEAAHFFVDNTDVRQLDYLQTSGFNVLRLLFVWEAYEPMPDAPDKSYLEMFSLIAREAWKRGIYTIVDFHQDAFARSVDYGCGEGFPPWALGEGLLKLPPRNDGFCANWMTMAFTDLNGVQRAFNDFYSGNAPNHLRSRYLQLFGTLAQRFRQVPGVIGYDVLNEPFSYSFDNDLKELYRDVGDAIRTQDPGAMLFLEPDLLADTNGKALLPKPFDTRTNVVYAPHFYDPAIMGSKNYSGPATSEQAFAAMRAFAMGWQAPLFLGEFGAPAVAIGASDYIGLLYDLLDGGQVGAPPASGAQWVYSPGWTPDKFDGWDTENFSIVSDQGPRPQLFVPRAYARSVSGIPTRQVVGANSIHLEWINAPQKSNQTVIFAPPPRPFAPVNINTYGVPSGQLNCQSAGQQQVVCSSDCWQRSFQVTITFGP